MPVAKKANPAAQNHPPLSFAIAQGTQQAKRMPSILRCASNMKPKMVALTGNTGVYLQYAHTRMSAILRKAAADPQTVITDPTTLSPPERSLALHLDAYNAVLVETMAEREPHRLAAYLYALAKAFTSFYEASPVLRAETETLRNNRLALVQLSKQTLAHGLGLLGVSAPDHM